MTDTPAPVPAKSSRLLKATILLGIVLLVLAGLWWWHNRPITPVVLSPAEQAVVEQKLMVLQPPKDPTYEKGAKEIILTERELNGLLNQNTELGKSLSFELATDAVHARLETDLDPNLPIVGGRKLKARARFLVHHTPGNADSIQLDDVTVWGISLPNEWLGGIKGQNLLGEVIRKDGSGGIPGVREFKIETGRLVIRLAD